MFAKEARAISEVYSSRALKKYGLESINQLEHALQAAWIAERQGETPSMILAALLHDVGHLTADAGENPAADGIDNRHEILGAEWLVARLPASISEPVRLHVEAKRYLCGSEPGYEKSLAVDSQVSLRLQGGAMSEREQEDFLRRPYARAAIRLRRIDDMAKTEGLSTPPLQHFLGYLARIEADPVDQSSRDSFHANGYLVIRNFFQPHDIQTIRSAATTLSATAQATLEKALSSGISLADVARSQPAALIVVPEADNARQVCRFEFLLGYDAQFGQFVQRHIQPVMQALHGEPFVPFKDKENEKHPGGGAFRPHQDFAAYQAFGPRYNATAMLSIDGQTHTNGCVEFAENWWDIAADRETVCRWVEGRPLFHHYVGGSKNGDIVDEVAKRLRWTPVEASPADLVIFDSFVPHKSGPNRSDASRRAMFLTYAAAREGSWYERYYEEKRRNYSDPKFHVSTPTAASDATAAPGL